MNALRLVLSLAVCLCAAPLVAAPPKVDFVFPAGAQRGTEVVVTAQGEFSTWPVQTWTDRDDVTVKCEAEKGKLRISLAAQTTPGVCWLRLYNAEGTSALRPFLIEQLPEVDEVEPNDTPSKPQSLSANQIINGRLNKSGDADAFTVPLLKGETLVAAVRAHSILNSPVDAVLQICELRERRASSLAGSPTQLEAFVLQQNNDTFGLDPQVSITAPRDGNYLIRVFAFSAEPNSTIGFTGGENCLYRLTLSTRGLVTAALPNTDAKELLAVGPGLPPEGIRANRIGSVAFVADIPGVAAAPPADSSLMNENTVLPPPSPDPARSFAGVLRERGSRQEWRFSATKGQALHFQVTSRSLGFPLDAVLTLRDATGKTLQQVDDAEKAADPQLTFAPPADGEYTLQLQDLHRRGGADYVYWLRAEAAVPQYSLSLVGDNFVLARGATLMIPVTVNRQRGHQGPIEVTATGLGGMPLPTGVTVTAVTSEGKGDTAKLVQLVLSAAADAPAAGLPIEIVGRAPDSKRVTQARAPQTFSLTESPPSVWLTVTQP